MSKKKIAGIDRPYTPIDLGKVIFEFMQSGGWANKADLDYFSTDSFDDTEIKSEDFSMFSITKFGSNEGIYTTFYIEFEGKKRIRLLTAKTLGESEKAFVKMHEMAAHVSYKFYKFVGDNLDKFIWSGYDVSYIKDGEEYGYVWTGSMERVAMHANELKNERGAEKVFYVDKSTRKKYEYKFQPNNV